jgi:hypothetical protein
MALEWSNVRSSEVVPSRHPDAVRWQGEVGNRESEAHTMDYNAAPPVTR